MPLIQIFARPPVEGKVKTRLMVDIGAKSATEIYLHCLNYTINLVKKSGMPTQLWLSEEGKHPLFMDLPINLQTGNNLGERMYQAMSDGLEQPTSDGQVILIGTDCIELTDQFFQESSRALKSADLVFVPAIDGGFALIGCRKIEADLFSGVEWGGNKVLAQTISNAQKCNLSYMLLSPVRDIDTLSDLHHYPHLQKLTHT